MATTHAKLAGKTALVTGAGRGLGGTIATALAEQGAALVICDINTEALETTRREIEALGVPCLALACDVSDREAVDRMFVQAAERFGSVDILVNNAAKVPVTEAEHARRNTHYEFVTKPIPRASMGIVAGLSDDDWLKWWGVNVHGVFYCTRAAVRQMQEKKWGRIINIASIAGLGTGSTHSPGYSATKAAVISLTKTTALDVAGAGIYVNAIACGGVHTPHFQAYLDGASEDQKNSLFQLMPVGRLGQPTEYAALAVFLAQEDHYIVGQVISPNGGTVI
jgi:3-oxoacyl-[acyl-carrier protein] reductase